MIKDYILLISAAVLCALNFAMTKAYQNRAGTTPASGIVFNIITGAASAVIFFAANGFKCGINTYSAVMAAAMTSLCVIYTMIGFKIMESETMALYTVFLMTGGMTVPYVWGLIFLNEPISVLRTIGLIILAAAVFITNTDGSGAKTKKLYLCIAVFLLNGFVSVVSKEHQINPHAVSATDFVILTNLIKAVVCTAILPFVKGEKSTGFSPKLLLYIIPGAVLSGVSYMFQLIGAVNLPATVLYPIMTGGTIIFSTISGIVIFKEKVGKRTALGIALCFIGTCMFL